MTVSGALLLIVQPSNFQGHEDYRKVKYIEESIHGIGTIYSCFDMEIFCGETTALSSKSLYRFIRRLGKSKEVDVQHLSKTWPLKQSPNSI